MKKNRLFLLLIVILAVIAGCCTPGKNGDDAVPATAVPVEVNEEISIITVGDNLLHMPVVNSGKKADGTYDYSHIFAKLQPRFKNADIAVIGQESVFGGEKYGYSGYPLFNSPSDMGKSIVNEGFDVVLHASNHVLDKWADGVENTLAFWKDYPDVTVLGINESIEQKNKVNIKEVKGAKIAMLNYTYGANGFQPPKGKEYLINFIDRDKIKSDLLYAEQNADFTVAFMHWGTEYSTKPDDFQKELALDMCTWGVDLIVGSHPHVIEPVEWVEAANGNKTLVYYSLGNFVSRQLEARNLLGGIADVVLAFDGTNVSIKDHSFVPIVTHYDTNYKNFAVYTLSSYTDELAAQHGVAPHDGAVSKQRWSDMVTGIFDGYDTSIIEY